MAAPGSIFVNCTASDKNVGVQPLVTLTEESPWEVDPGGAYIGKIFLVYVNDLQDVTRSCELSVYADDTHLTSALKK